MRRKLSIADFVQELYETGSITDYPTVIRRHENIERVKPLFVLQREKKYFIAISDPENVIPTDEGYKIDFASGIPKHIASFPVDTDVATLFGSSNVREYGPQGKFPGGCVTMQFNRYKQKSSMYLNVGYIQFLFKQGSPVRLTRSIVTKYIGHREKLIDYVMNLEELKTINEIEAETVMKRRGNEQAFERAIARNPHLDFQSTGWGFRKKGDI